MEGIDKQMYASVVIPTYNRKEVLAKTLDALLEQTVGSDQYEIIVVDDASSDGTRAYLAARAAETPSLTFIGHELNKGRSETRNDGIRTACGDIVIFLDDDNLPDRALVERHLEYHLQAGDEHIAVMGDVSFPSRIRIASNFARYLESRYLGHRTAHARSNLNYSDLPPRFFGTLNCSARRSDLLKVGMFDPAFRYYGGEDEYLGYCLQREKVRLVFGEGARSLHCDDISLERYRAKMLETGGTGLKHLLVKAPGYFAQTQVRFLLRIDRKNDSFKDVLKKVAMRLLANRGLMFVLERWAISTDRLPSLYFAPAYRLLAAGWLIQGQRKQFSRPLVSYDPAAQRDSAEAAHE